MTDEQTNETDTQGTEANPEPTAEKSLLQRSVEAADRLEALNKTMAENLERQEKLAAESLLGGSTEGRVEKKEEEVSPEDYAKQALEGKLNG